MKAHIEQVHLLDIVGIYLCAKNIKIFPTI